MAIHHMMPTAHRNLQAWGQTGGRASAARRSQDSLPQEAVGRAPRGGVANALELAEGGVGTAQAVWPPVAGGALPAWPGTVAQGAGCGGGTPQARPLAAHAHKHQQRAHLGDSSAVWVSR